MREHIYLSAGLLIVCALVVVFGYLGQGWLTQSTEGPPGDLAKLRDGLRRSRELEEKLTTVQRLGAAKEVVAGDVIAGRLTLLEAAAEFRTLDGENPSFDWTTFRRYVPGDSDGERYCRAVMLRVSFLLANRPHEAEPVLARLEAELQEHLRQGGIAGVMSPEDAFENHSIDDTLTAGAEAQPPQEAEASDGQQPQALPPGNR